MLRTRHAFHAWYQWLLAVLLALAQELVYKQRPFLPRGEQGRDGSQKLSWLPLKRSSRSRSRGLPDRDIEKDDPGALSPSGIPLTSTAAAAVGAGGPSVLARGFSSRTAHASVPESVGSATRSSTLDGDGDGADREIRALTRNYERALAALNDPNAPLEDDDDNVRPSVLTTNVPIIYRVGSMHVHGHSEGDSDGASGGQLQPVVPSAYPQPPSPRTQRRALPIPVPEADAAGQPVLAALQQQQIRQASPSPPVAHPHPAALAVPRPLRQDRDRDPASPSSQLFSNSRPDKCPQARQSPVPSLS